MEIVSVNIGDIFDEYIKIFPHLNTIELANGIAGNNAKWYILQLNKKNIGVYTIYNIKNDIILYNFGIQNEYRNMGYGKYMIKHIINEYKNKDIYLFVNRSNDIAMKLYKSNGFKFSKRYVPPVNEICMKL
jgi:ribosomal protein S18 acetylase RimI-like enzyme